MMPLGPPRRYIFEQADQTSFLSSGVCNDILLFVGSLNAAVQGKACSAACALPPFVDAVVEALKSLEALVGECPPLQQPMRYGNKGFRVWHKGLLERGLGLCQGVLRASAPAGEAPAAAGALELATYLCESFGNATRIDYGTGHEVSFVFFLAAAARLRCYAAGDLPALGLRALPAYLRLCRLLQRTYGLEPAGSHGVWSLDDYHFLPFLLGSSQLQGHPHMRPRGALSEDTREALGSAEFMYIDALGFITDVKRGAPFEEHSPMLASLAAKPTWAAVNEELGRLYRREVVGKLPVAQHFLFGELLKASWAPSREPITSEAGEALLAVLQAAGQQPKEAQRGGEGAAGEGPAGGGDGASSRKE
jgi:hypothetical protein